MQSDPKTLESQAKLREERLNICGGSDIGSLYNLGYGCRKRLWFEKRNIEPDFPQGYSPHLERGTMMEPVSRSLYEMRSGRVVRQAAFKVSRFWKRLGAHVDGLIYPTGDRASWGVLEVKNVGYRMLKQYKSEGLPEEYILQLQAGMAVHEATWGSFAIHCLDPWQLHFFDIDLDSKIVDQIVSAVDEFWKQVENGPAPDPLEPTDRRCHSCIYRRTCQGEAILDAVPEQDREGEVDDSLEPLLREYDYRKELADEAASLLEETKTALREKLGERPLVLAGGIPIRHSVFNVTRWDTKALNALWDTNPDFRAQFQKYRKKSQQKRLSIGIKYGARNGNDKE